MKRVLYFFLTFSHVITLTALVYIARISYSRSSYIPFIKPTAPHHFITRVRTGEHIITNYESARMLFEPIISIMQSSNYSANEKEKALHSHILIYNDGKQGTRKYKDLPYLQYIEQIKTTLHMLEKSRKSHYLKNDTQTQTNISTLIAGIEYLNRQLITSSLYHNEKIQIAKGPTSTAELFKGGAIGILRKFMPF